MSALYLPTSYEVGVLAGGVRPGDTVVIVGSGPIGLATIITAKLFSPSHIVSVDIADARLDAAKQVGADILINSDRDDPLEKVQAISEGLGADVVIEAVGVPASFEMCTRLLRAGGHVANVGVHGKPATLHLEDLWIRDVTITTGLVDTTSTPTLLRLLKNGQFDTLPFVTHRFGFDQILDGYDVFSRPDQTRALKVVMTRDA